MSAATAEPFALETDRKKRLSWLKTSTSTSTSTATATDGFQAHSFFGYRAFSDVMVHVIAGLAMVSPFVGLLPVLFPDSIDVAEGGLSTAWTWAGSALLAAIGAGLLYGHRQAGVEHVLVYDPATKAFETTAFNRAGARVSQATIRAAEVRSVVLVDDEGARRTKQTHPSTDVSLTIAVGKTTRTLLRGREGDVWPVYVRVLELAPNVRR